MAEMADIDKQGESPAQLGVAEAKQRFSELLDRASGGERIVISRRGRPAGVLVPPTPDSLRSRGGVPTGFAALAGALADWDELEAVMAEVYASRRQARDRPAPELDEVPLRRGMTG